MHIIHVGIHLEQPRLFKLTDLHKTSINSLSNVAAFPVGGWVIALEPFTFSRSYLVGLAICLIAAIYVQIEIIFAPSQNRNERGKAKKTEFFFFNLF